MDNPTPVPCPIATLLCKLGNLKVLTPSPPKLVPNNENKAAFCDIGNKEPSHSAHPVGAKLNPKISISPINGSVPLLLG